MINTLITLYITFLKIGTFAFGGGYAVLPLIQKYIVVEQKWISMKELTDLVSLSQVTPGPIGINSATFVGTKVAGLSGAIIATIAEITPCCIIMLILGHFIFKGKKFKILDYILKGLRPAISGLILIAAINMFKSATILNGKISILGSIGFIIGLILYSSKKVSIVKIIGISAGIGAVIGLIL